EHFGASRPRCPRTPPFHESVARQWVIVRLISAVCCTAPEAAVTVTVAVVGGGGGLEPPPQAEIAIRVPERTKVQVHPAMVRRFLKKSSRPASATVPGSIGSPAGRPFDADVLAAIVIVVVAAFLPSGVTVAGLKLHVVPAGSPEQSKVTEELKPFSGVIVRVALPELPEGMVTEGGFAPKVKLGGML